MTVSGVWNLTRWDESVWTTESVPIVPYLGTYNDLVNAVIDLIRDSDVDADRAGRFIRQASDKLQRDLMDDKYGGGVPRQMLVRGTSTTNTDSSVELPNDYITARDVMIQGAPSRYVAQEKVQSQEPGFGQSDVTLDYYARLPILSDANPTNWLFTIAADTYLYGAALQYVPWAQEPQKQAMWDSYYTDAVAGVKESNAVQPRGGWTAMTGRPYHSVYTVVANTMLFGANQDIR